MSTVVNAIKLVLKDIASLGSSANRPLVAAIAGGLVAIIAAIAGVHLTAAEVTGWIVAVAGLAATLEKAAGLKAAARK